MNYNNIGSKIKILSILVNKDLDKKLKQFSPKLSGTQTITLLYLFEHQDQTVLQTDLAKFLYVSHPTARGIIKRLMKLKLIVVYPLSSDKRQMKIQLSNEGKEFMSSFDPKMNEIFEQENQLICKGLNRKDIKKFHEILDLSINNLK